MSLTDEQLADFERYLEHSLTLNAVAFRLAQALGDVPEGQEWAEGDPVELADRLIAERDKAREKLHIPTLAEASTPGVWNVYCVACSAAVEDYVTTCSRWRAPAQLVAYTELERVAHECREWRRGAELGRIEIAGLRAELATVTAERDRLRGDAVDAVQVVADLTSLGAPDEMCLCDLTYPGAPGAVEVHPDADCPIHGESTSDGGSGS